MGGTNEERQLCHGSQEEGISVLVVEDNDDFRRFLVGCLKEHYQVFEASNGKEALEILSQQSVQMVISDVMMPVMDGLELCHAVKTDIRFSHIPVILLTARTAEEHVLGGLREGADDYITKPFNILELKARIRALLRRSSGQSRPAAQPDPELLTVGDLTLDTRQRVAIRDGKAIDLTAKEYDLVELLMKNPRRVYSLSLIHI